MTTIMISAGEASGDQHGALLVREALKLNPELTFFGMGGAEMRTAGVETLVDAADMAVVGFVEVLLRYRQLAAVLEKMRQLLQQRRPDLLILVDYPDFNLRLAATAKAAGIKVLHYISPQVWAWRRGRVKMIGDRVDHMAVLFPFEVPIYQTAGIPVTFIGHSLVDEVGSPLSEAAAKSRFGVNDATAVVGLFPGSRRSEIKALLPLLLESARQIAKSAPHTAFLLPLASTLNDSDIALIKAYPDLRLKVIRGELYPLMRASDVVVTASGTVTLELALMEVPLIVIYRVAALSYFFMSRLIQVDHIALCNIVAEQRIAPELIQQEASVANITRHLQQLLNDPQGRQTMRNALKTVRQRLGSGGAAKRIAALTVAMADNQPL
ncbi:MAG: lipid-A-disaccharide synthase [Gammaproteobacteria bacterium]|nr:lipid-A-disaccharide synthase [Gammaproteobacteria bacterium]